MQKRPAVKYMTSRHYVGRPTKVVLIRKQIGRAGRVTGLPLFDYNVQFLQYLHP